MTQQPTLKDTLARLGTPFRQSLQNKVILVTGAASGIGRASAFALANQGAQVVLSDFQDELGLQAAREIRDNGGKADFLHCDVSKREEIKALVREIEVQYGRLDAAYNNAGTEGKPAPLHECTEENWNKTLTVNLSSTFWCMQEEVRLMLKHGGGSIINCASIAGLRGFANLPAYVASKHGVVGLTKAAALDYAAQNIRINVICPGVIQTPMIDRFTGGSKEALAGLSAQEPIGRVGTPDEIAGAVLWLCSPLSHFVTGTEIVVDEGWCAK